MLKVFVKYSVDVGLAGFLKLVAFVKLVAFAVDVGLAGFLKPVACAVDVVPVDASMHVSLAVDAIHVELSLLVVLAVDVIHVALPMLVLLPFGDVFFVILIIPMHLEVLQLLQIPFFLLLAEYLLPLLHVAMFVL